MVVQIKDRRNIFAQSGTWFRNMLEWIEAAYTIMGSALWEYRRGERLWEGRARHGAISMEHCWPRFHVIQESQELSVCNFQGLLHWAAKFSPTKHLHTQVLSTALAGHRSPDSSVCGTQLCLAAGRASTLLLPMRLLTWGATGQLLKVMMFSICIVSLLSAGLRKSCLSSCITAALPPCPVHPVSLTFPSTPYLWMTMVGYIWRSAHLPHHHTFASKIHSCFSGGEPYHPPSSGC